MLGLGLEVSWRASEAFVPPHQQTNRVYYSNLLRECASAPGVRGAFQSDRLRQTSAYSFARPPWLTLRPV